MNNTKNPTDFVSRIFVVEMAVNRSFASFVCFANLSHFMSVRLCPWQSPNMDYAVSIPANEKQQVFRLLFRLVEMAVIETASENAFPQLSTSVAIRFRFPCLSAV